MWMLSCFSEYFVAIVVGSGFIFFISASLHIPISYIYIFPKPLRTCQLWLYFCPYQMLTWALSSISIHSFIFYSILVSSARKPKAKHENKAERKKILEEEHVDQPDSSNRGKRQEKILPDAVGECRYCDVFFHFLLLCKQCRFVI